MELNWDLCIICQKDTTEPLRCPLQTPGTSGDKSDVYRSFLANVEQFRAIDALPTELHFSDAETASNFASHSASWHKSCHLKFNNSKLAKARKSKMKNPVDSGGEKPPGRDSVTRGKSLDVQKCFFCENGRDQGFLHEVSTFDADRNIRTMITELNDTKLMTRIVGGDLIATEAKYHLPCLTKLRNRYRSLTRMTDHSAEDKDEKMTESRAFVELKAYIEKSVDAS